MAPQEKVMGDLLTMTHSIMEVGSKSMEMIQDQFTKNLDMTMNNMRSLHERSQEAVTSLFDQASKMRKSYIEAVDEGMGLLQRQIKSVEQPPQPRGGK